MKHEHLLVALFVLSLGGFSDCTNRVPQTDGSFNWPCWRGPDGNGISQETDWDPRALAGGPQVLWKVDVGFGYSNVAIRDNRLYSIGQEVHDAVILCLDANTGKEMWRYVKNDSRWPQATPTVDNRSVYALTTEGILLCLNSRNGRQRWQKDLVSEYGAVKPFYGFAGSPVVAGKFLILNVNTWGMALNKSTGKLQWTSDALPPAKILGKCRANNRATYMTPVLYKYEGRLCALIYSWKGLYAVEPKTGKALWLYEWKNYDRAKMPDPVTVADRILIADDQTDTDWEHCTTLLKIAGGKPTVLWKSTQLFSDVSSPVVLDGYIYGCHGGPSAGSPPPTLRYLDLESGHLKWIKSLYELGSHLKPTWISLTAGDSRLIALTDRGILYVAEASSEGFKMISSCDVFAGKNRPREFFTPPVLCNAKIYCRNFAGDLICINVGMHTSASHLMQDHCKDRSFQYLHLNFRQISAGRIFFVYRSLSHTDMARAPE